MIPLNNKTCHPTRVAMYTTKVLYCWSLHVLDVWVGLPNQFATFNRNIFLSETNASPRAVNLPCIHCLIELYTLIKSMDCFIDSQICISDGSGNRFWFVRTPDNCATAIKVENRYSRAQNRISRSLSLTKKVHLAQTLKLLTFYIINT